MAVFICGDTHGDIDFGKLNSKNFTQAKEGDFVIICGDTAICWDNDKSDRYIQKWYNSKPWTTLFIQGNHDNIDLIRTYPLEDFMGGEARRIGSKIWFLENGQVFTLEGKTYFIMGGATSHDKERRKEGIDWWANEIPSTDSIMDGIDKLLIEYDNKVDFILSHCASDTIMNKIAYWYEHDIVTNALEVITKEVEFQKHFFGHYHIDLNFNNKFVSLYDKIYSIEEDKFYGEVRK